MRLHFITTLWLTPTTPACVVNQSSLTLLIFIASWADNRYETLMML